MKGLTLIEILITIFLIVILASFIVSIGLNFYKSQQLESQAQAILQTLRRTQSKAMSVELDSSFGVYLTNNNYVLFKGDSYATRDIQYDEVFDLPEIIRVDGPSEVIFLKAEGILKENPAYCGGICIPCSNFTNRGSCRAQDGCSWRAQRCTGTCTSCSNYQNQSGCENQSGCTWYPITQGGDIILTSDGLQKIININAIGRINLE